MGTGIGLTETNPVFVEGFRDFLVKLDDLQDDDGAGGITRHAGSALSEPPPVQFGLNISESVIDADEDLVGEPASPRPHRPSTQLPIV
jgi:hypothetical protein